MDGLIYVDLERHPTDGYGILFAGAEDEEMAEENGYGIFISGLKRGGAGDRHPDVKSGLQVLSLNGEDLVSATLVDLEPVLTTLGSEMHMTLRENDWLFSVFTFSKPLPLGNQSFGLPYASTPFKAYSLVSVRSKRASLYMKPAVETVEPEAVDTPPMAEATTKKKSTKRRKGEMTIEVGPSGDFGLQLKGPKDDDEADEHGYGVVIGGIDPDGAAADLSSLQLGYQVLRIDGKPLEGALLADAEALLAQAAERGHVDLRLRENAALKEAYFSSTEYAESSIQLNSRVAVKGYNTCYGTVRFIGEHHAGKGPRILVELDDPVGTNNGTVGGFRYAKSVRMLHGVLVLPKKVRLATKPGEIEVTINRGPKGFGLSFGGAKTPEDAEVEGYGVFISGAKQGSPAAQQPALKPGLKILEINRISMRKSCLRDLRETISKVGDRLTLILSQKKSKLHGKFERQKTLQKQSKSNPSMVGSTEYSLLRTSDESGHGITLSPSPTGVTISSVSPNSAASRAGVKPGQVIVAIDDVSVLGKDKLAAEAALGDAGFSLTLVLKDEFATEELPVSVSIQASEFQFSSNIPGLDGIFVVGITQ